MKDHLTKITPPQFLSGWKEIANYLRKGVRTVQRYERMFGLPVRRPAGKPWGSVIATKAELDAWVKATPFHDEFPLKDPQPEYVSQARDIRKGLAEMLVLRDQMFALRAEVKKSVETLANSLGVLQTELTRTSWKGAVPVRSDATLYSADESKLIGTSGADLLGAPVKYPRAS